MGDLPRDLGVAVEEEERALLRVRSERRLPQEEDRDVRGDDRERHPGEPPGGVRVPKGDHGPCLRALATRGG